MKSTKCNKCGQQGLVWQKSKNNKWYLAVEKNWQGDMGGVRTFYPAHNCKQGYQETDPTALADEKNSRMFDAGYAGII